MNRRAARESAATVKKGSASRGRKSQSGGTDASGVTDVIARQSHLPQNCKSFIRHNDPRAITSRATYGCGFVIVRECRLRQRLYCVPPNKLLRFLTRSAPRRRYRVSFATCPGLGLRNCAAADHKIVAATRIAIRTRYLIGSVRIRYLIQRNSAA